MLWVGDCHGYAGATARGAAFIAQYGPTLLKMGTDWAWQELERAVIKGDTLGTYAQILAAKSKDDPYLAEEAKKLSGEWWNDAEGNAQRWDNLKAVGEVLKPLIVPVLLALAGL